MLIIGDMGASGWASELNMGINYADGRKFNGVDANVPDLPHIIVTPVILRVQWESKIKRFLVHAAFDLFPYLGRHEYRANW